MEYLSVNELCFDVGSLLNLYHSLAIATTQTLLQKPNTSLERVGKKHKPGKLGRFKGEGHGAPTRFV